MVGGPHVYSEIFSSFDDVYLPQTQCAPPFIGRLLRLAQLTLGVNALTEADQSG